MTKIQQPTQKTSKLNFDENWDFIFAKSLSTTVRWILTLPMGVLTIILFHLAFGIFISKFDSIDSDIVSIGVRVIFILVQWLFFIQAMTGMAPVKNKFRFSCIAAIIPAIFYVFTLWDYFIEGTFDSYDISSLYFIIPSIGGLIGVICGIYSIKKQSANKDVTNNNLIQ